MSCMSINDTSIYSQALQFCTAVSASDTSSCSALDIAFFTALSNGLVSAILSFLRTLVFQIAAILLLPRILGSSDGVWFSIVAAELLALAVTAWFFAKKRGQYHYA